jgi:hypothetical protein
MFESNPHILTLGHILKIYPKCIIIKKCDNKDTSINNNREHQPLVTFIPVDAQLEQKLVEAGA